MSPEERKLGYDLKHIEQPDPTRGGCLTPMVFVVACTTAIAALVLVIAMLTNGGGLT